MLPKDAKGIANSVDPDQTAPPLGAVWSWSALFDQACLSENLGLLWYCTLMCPKDAKVMAQSVDPDQSAPSASGSTLFVQTCLFENLY